MMLTQKWLTAPCPGAGLARRAWHWRRMNRAAPAAPAGPSLKRRAPRRRVSTFHGYVDAALLYIQAAGVFHECTPDVFRHGASTPSTSIGSHWTVGLSATEGLLADL